MAPKKPVDIKVAWIGGGFAVVAALIAAIASIAGGHKNAGDKTKQANVQTLDNSNKITEQENAAGTGNVLIKGNAEGTTVASGGSQILQKKVVGGDEVAGDKVAGDKVGRDKITVSRAVFFSLISSMGSALNNDKNTIDNTKRKDAVTALTVAYNKLEALSRSLKDFSLVLTAQKHFLQHGQVTLSVDEMNPYARKSYYFFENEAHNDLMAGMDVQLAGWRRIEGTDKMSPVFKLKHDVDKDGREGFDKNTMNYSQFLKILIPRAVQRVNTEIQEVANAISAVLRILQEKTVKIFDGSLYNTLFDLDVGDMLFSYWVVAQPPEFKFSSQNETGLLTFASPITGNRQNIAEDYAKLAKGSTSPSNFKIDNVAQVDGAIDFVAKLHSQVEQTRIGFAEFIKQHFTLDEFMNK